jgi:hypothetical protein
MYDLEHDGDGRNHMYRMLSEFQEMRSRQCVFTRPGAPERDRTRGIADKAKGTSKPKSKRQRVENPETVKSKKHRSSHSQEKGYKEDAAVRHLQKHGAKIGWILECYPDPEGLKKKERWFMRVENGLKTKDSKGETHITSCLWMKANSITEVFNEKAVSCEVLSVAACGPPSFFKDVGQPTKLKIATLPPASRAAKNFAAASAAAAPPPPNLFSTTTSTWNIATDRAKKTAAPAVSGSDMNFDGSAWNIATDRAKKTAAPAVSDSDEDVPIAAKVVAARAATTTNPWDDEWFLNKARDSVKAVNLLDLKAAMKAVPGANECRTKESLIFLMVRYNFTYDIPTIVSD